MESSSSAEEVRRERGGAVLGKKTILKSDHFPGCQNRRLESPLIAGAPNYRRAREQRVHGVAIPTAEGIRNVLKHIGEEEWVVWINLREEPVVYVNGRPFVLRDVERPFSNLEYTGISASRLEQMESRLKEDALAEASRYGGRILLTDELPDGQMVDLWEPLSSVMTPLELYSNLHLHLPRLRYHRVPVTDEKSPKESDFDLLVRTISDAAPLSHVVFNCQMGRGRTTTGMVIATLLFLHRSHLTPSSSSSPDDALLRGEYAVIRSLVRVLEVLFTSFCH